MIEIDRRESFYQQEYRGCARLLRDTNRHRRESGRERIRFGMKFYGGDDCANESGSCLPCRDSPAKRPEHAARAAGKVAPRAPDLLVAHERG
nr:hypothetical protein [Burkholderia plantarii]